jgi:hypothetical protein
MRVVGLMEKFALKAVVVVVAAKENMVAVEVVGTRITVTGMASVCVKPIGMICLICVISLSGNSLVFVGEPDII